jgi:hypothetical protein
MPFDNAIIIGDSDGNLSTLTSAVNTILAAEIAATTPAPIQVINIANAAGTVGGLNLFAMTALLRFQE